ncbi:hypothetical protein C7999DRAFT_45058 [Corynascus novoguineensis]|uniref:Uncharacterized protein n=1 Tax=Corynascus novoguineensis TaxID=1126955 RepID=A0AAN7HIC8_9PEZI|nr:hypothetical protein C7999DRAFT_45058 [Corynascus novoguineensis]
MANTPTSTLPTGMLGPTESTIMAIVQQVLAAQAGKHQEDFPAWRDRLLCVLGRYGLDKYVLADVLQPENPMEVKQWLDDRADIEAYFQAKARDLDPKKTFDKLTRYFENGLADGPSRVNYIKDRLQTDESLYNLPDGGYAWLVVKGIAYEYPDVYNRYAMALQNKTLT